MTMPGPVVPQQPIQRSPQIQALVDMLMSGKGGSVPGPVSAYGRNLVSSDPRMSRLETMQNYATNAAPVGHWFEGASRLGVALLANRLKDKIHTDAGKATRERAQAFARALASIEKGDRSSAASTLANTPGFEQQALAIALRGGEKPDPWADYKVVGDDVLQIDQSGKPTIAFDGKPQPTTRQRDLEAAGFTPGTPEYQEALRVSMNTPGVSVNMQPGESKANEELGKAVGSRLAAQLDAGDKALSNFQTLSLMESAAAQYVEEGGALGALATPQAFATSLMQAVNVDPSSLGLPQDAGPAQVLNSLSNKLVLGKIGGPDGMPANNFSDADREFIESTVPRLNDTPDAFRAKLFIDRRMSERAISIGEIVSEGYSAGKTAQQISADVAKARRQPLFSPEEIKSLKANDPGSTRSAPKPRDNALMERLRAYGAEIEE